MIAFYGARDSAAVITHRVVENNTLMGQFTTKGDANEKADVNPVEYEEFIGRRGSWRYLFWDGRHSSLPCTEGKAAAAGVIGAALFLQILGSVLGKQKKQREETEQLGW